MILGEKGQSFIAIYKYMKAIGKTWLFNPERSVIESQFNNSKFLLYITDFGTGLYDTLENSVIEALLCGCMPVLHSKWCTAKYKGYPAQVGSLEASKSIVLNEDVYNACKRFMEDLNEPYTSCGTPEQYRADIEKLMNRSRNPKRQDGIREVIKMIRYGKHLRRIDWT
jgi:hypothetical protein